MKSQFAEKVSSPFYNQAETHLFSDWLLPYLFEEDFGIPDRTELYFGGFPDPSPLIDRTHQGAPEVEASAFADLNLSSFGKKLETLMKGRRIFDLGCGKPELSIVPRLIAQYFGAESYAGVDLWNLEDEVRSDEFPELGSFESRFIQADLFQFLSEFPMQDKTPKGFLFLGLEWMTEADQKRFLPQLESEMIRVCRPQDWILLGAGGFDWPLPQNKFQLVYSDPVHALYVRKREPLFNLIFRRSNPSSS